MLIIYFEMPISPKLKKEFDKIAKHKLYIEVDGETHDDEGNRYYEDYFNNW